MKNLFVTALIASIMAQSVHSAIVTDGLWTGYDWYDNVRNIGVSNGVPYSLDASMSHFIDAPLSRDAPMDDYMTLTNVQRVNQILPKSEWHTVFPQANALYTYEGFLKAVGKFPKFCDDWSGSSLITKEWACRRELATLFAHWT